MSFRRFASLTLVIALLPVSAAFGASGLVGFKFESDRSSCLYRLGDEAVVVVTATNGLGETLKSGNCRVVIDNYGRKTVKTIDSQDFSRENPFTLRGTLDKPGFLRFRVEGVDSTGAWFGGQWAVGFEPEKIRPATARPDDFDSFWNEAMAKFEKEVPVDAQMELDEKESNGSHDCYRLTFATIPAGRVIRGHLTIPKGEGPWPVFMTVPGAGSGSWGCIERRPRAAWLRLNVVDYPCFPDAEHPADRLYTDQNVRWSAKTGANMAKWYFHGDLSRGREEFFYFGAILGINRAVNWISVLPRIKPRSIIYAGQSQGGAFGIYLAALNDNIERAAIGEPAITDLCGVLADGRQSGWPSLPEQYAGRPFYDNMMRLLPYFDCAHFVPRIKIPTRWVVGFTDALCPPHAVWAAYNCLSTTDRRMQNWPGLGHGIPRPLYQEAYSACIGSLQ